MVDEKIRLIIDILTPCRWGNNFVIPQLYGVTMLPHT